MRRAALVLALALAGCSNEKAELRLVVRQGRALLRHPAPGDADWEARRVIFLTRAQEVLDAGVAPQGSE